LRTLNVTMQASQEVGAVVVEGDSVLTAVGIVKINEVTGSINATVTADNIATGDDVTMVHIHSGFAGENGPVLVGFTRVSDNPTVFALNTNIANLANFPGNDLETFLDGGWYLNLHTVSNPAGHVRGQMFTNEIDVSRSELQGQQENPPVANAEGISGVGYVTINPAEEEIVANVSVEGFIPFLDAPIGPVHLHSAFAGANGPVFLPLFPVDGSETVFRATAADAIAEIDFSLIADGGTYINVHSAENGSGEIRGQVVPRGIDVARSELQGAQENPPVVNAPGISGIGYVTINPADQAIVGNVTVEGFVPFLDAPIGPVHLHNAFAGENGPVFLPLFPVNGSETVFSGTETDAIDTINFDAIAQGGTYINVHSAENGSGEIRGQVVPRDVDVSRSELQGAQENPPVVNAPGISGIGYVTAIPAQEEIVANVTVEGFVPFLDAPIGPVHLHNGFAGENGPVFLPLWPVNGSETVFRATSADAIDTIDFERIADGGAYINVHSAENGSGEIRGQVVPRDVDVSRSELQGAQENPPVVNAEGISGIGYVTVNTADEAIVGNVTVEGFIPFLDAPIGPVHLHNGFAGENGPVFLPLFPVDGSETVFSGTEADAIDTIDFERIADGGTYINVHSVENAGGEIRGQVVPRGVDVTRSELQGQQENPPVINAEGISGVGYVTINPEEETIVGTVSVEGFIPFLDAPIGPVHLHNGFAGENGPVFLPLFAVEGSETSFRGTETDAIDTIDFENIALGGAYINVHSEENASGEIRGQVVPRGVDVARSELQGQQENPPVVNAEGISGIGYVTVNPALQSIVGTVTVEGFVPFLDAPIGPVHLHNGFAGENGPVFLPLFVLEGSETSFRGTASDAIDTIDFERIANGGVYINVHSAENPSGEIRGQVVTRDVDVSRSELQGQQENPPVVNADGIAGLGYVTVNPMTQSIVATATVEGFVPFLDAPIGPVHLHNGFAGENGPVFLPLRPVNGSDTVFRGTALDAIDVVDFERFAQGGVYLNVHSEENAGGEIRGQMLTNDLIVVRSEMQTEQEVPAVVTPASDDVSGIGYITFDTQNAAFNPIVNVTVSGFEATMVHVHRGGVAGVAGPVQIGLTDISPDEAPGTMFTSNDGEIFSLNGLLNGAYYFNAHSTANPAGEVRGQILTDNVRAFRAEANGSQVLPDTNPTTATGIGFITVNLATEAFIANLQVADFDPAPASVTLNVGGDNNVVFREFTDEGDGFFTVADQVNNLQGLLNGAYSIQADEVAP
jgi:hypothetical protein